MSQMIDVSLDDTLFCIWRITHFAAHSLNVNIKVKAWIIYGDIQTNY